ncbi:CAP domain-containing protein [Pseudarthrobacter sp. PS3-L1]|uniref:CAP domain-containing protein n=1 Tax=Pseudarthrobacter sp. PS3-L1 TaxID=3046207 RepID=UPI0024B8B99A|nr:CAP domain-containing protein [Pseudarthrobacter sp. PS3-L1]
MAAIAVMALCLPGAGTGAGVPARGAETPAVTASAAARDAESPAVVAGPDSSAIPAAFTAPEPVPEPAPETAQTTPDGTEPYETGTPAPTTDVDQLALSVPPEQLLTVTAADAGAAPGSAPTSPDGLPGTAEPSEPSQPSQPSESPTDQPPATPVGEEPPAVPVLDPLWGPDSLAEPQAAAGTAQARMAAPAASAPAVASPQALVSQSNAAAITTVFNAINAYRASRNLPAIRYHATVAGMAQEWSNTIASREVIEHRSNFWTDPRALNPNNGAGEVIAVRWDRDAAQLVEWWKTSPSHNAALLDPRFSVMGIGVTYTDGNWQTTPNRFTMWGVVNFFGYATLPAGTTAAPAAGAGGSGGTVPPAPPAANLCDPTVKIMPQTQNLSKASIKGPADLVGVNSAGKLVNSVSLGSRKFAAPAVIGTGFSTAQETFVTDWDRDGVYDVLVQWKSGKLALYRGKVGGGFLAPLILGTSGWSPLKLAVGGWCANNRMPQILALDGAGNVWLYPNQGSGDLFRRTLAVGGVSAKRLAMVDASRDGFQDLVALRSDGTVQLYRGNGSPKPRAEARPTIASGWQDVAGIRALRNVTGLNSTGVALRRGTSVVQYWDLSSGKLASPSSIAGAWTGIRIAQ